MNIAIVEDNKQAQDVLVSNIENSAKKLDLVVNIYLFNAGWKFADKLDSLYDIIYFDVGIKYIDGVTAATKNVRKIRKY